MAVTLVEMWALAVMPFQMAVAMFYRTLMRMWALAVMQFLISFQSNEVRQGWTRGLIVEAGTGRERHGWVRWVRPDEKRIMTFFIDTISSFRLEQ